MGRSGFLATWSAALAFVTLGLPPAPAQAADPVIAAAGDIACSSSTVRTADCHQMATSDLLVSAGLAKVLVLGDNQYSSGSLSNYRRYYDPSWGRVKSITRPVLGNHEESGNGYFDYFNGVGAATGPAGTRGEGWYSFDVGDWHLIALNSNCDRVACGAGSAQEQWLRDDLSSRPDQCTLAYWHHPRFSSGHDGDNEFMQPIWQALYDYEVDVALVGHSHHYERYAPQDADGNLDPSKGIREFVVGTGGAFFTGVGSGRRNSEVRQGHTFGVLFLTLRPSSYDWEFVPEAGKTWSDSGSGDCHRSGATSVPGAAITGGTLSYVAASGQGNRVTIARSGSEFTITDTGISSMPDADGSGGCSVSGNRATCPASGVTALKANLKDGNDTAAVSAANDATLLGGAGADHLTGGDGRDTLEGSTGNDNLDGGRGNDFLDGGSDNDSLEGGPDNDALRGGTGTDTASYSRASAGVRVTLASSSSQSTGGAGSDTLSSLENLTGGSGGDNLTGNSGTNVLSGGSGDDTLISRDAVADQAACGSGSDFLTGDTHDVAQPDCERFDNGVPPNTAITSGPPATSNSASATFGFASSEPASTFECRLDAGSWGSCTSPRVYAGLTKGAHTFRVRASDEFGNLDATEAIHPWTVVFLPRASFTFTPASPFAGDLVAFSSTSSGTGTDRIIRHEWDLDGNGSYETDTGLQPGVSRSFASAGTATIRLRVTDEDADTSTAEQSVTVANRPSPIAQPPAGSQLQVLADRIAPRLALRGPRRLRVRGRSLKLVTWCNEPCTLTASARVSVPGASGLFRAKKVRRSLRAGVKATLVLRFSRKALAAIRLALDRGQRLSARVKVLSRDRAANVRVVERSIRLRR